MPYDLEAPVTRNTDLGHGNFLIEFEAPEIVGCMKPAQFFMIGVPGSKLLLRRPFSVCGLPGTFDDGRPGSAQVLYKVVGEGTALLASLRAGARLEVLGPLGRGFEAPEPGRRALFLAGGIGVAPFPAFAAALRREGREVGLLYGARTAGDLPLLEWFERVCAPVEVATEDGSRGRRGLVTALLEELLRKEDPSAFHVYACGPQPMLKAVAQWARRHDVRCDLSLEARMACGFGVCLGCVVPTRGSGPEGDVGFERVCVEGPVMRAERLAW